MTSERFPVMKIGSFQFNNLMKSPVTYLLMDLRAEGAQPTLPRATRMDEASAIQTALKDLKSKESPVIVICETGAISKDVAQALADAEFKNVVWLEGGTQTLEDAK